MRIADIDIDYHFRHILPTRADRQAVLEHLLSLSGEDRMLRFAGPVSEQFVRNYAERLFERGRIGALDRDAIGYFDPQGLRAMGECHIQGTGKTREAELAFSVDSGLQGKGIGSALFRYALAIARNRGAKSACIYTLPHNLAMKRVASKHGMTLSFDGDVRGTLSVRPADPVSLLQEWGGENLAWLVEMSRKHPLATG